MPAKRNYFAGIIIVQYIVTKKSFRVIFSGIFTRIYSGQEHVPFFLHVGLFIRMVVAPMRC